MSEKEMLELIVKEVQEIKQDNKSINAKLDTLDEKVNILNEKVNSLDEKVNSLDKKVNSLDEKVNSLDEKVNSLDEKVNSLDEKVNSLDEKVNSLDEKVYSLEKEVKQNTITLETTIKQCIDVIGDGYQANFEKIEGLHIDSMRSKITQLELLHKFNASEIERIKAKIG